MDILSSVLDKLKFSGSVFMRAEVSAPWAVSAPTAEGIPIAVIPRKPDSQIVLFHFPLEGDFWFHTDHHSPLHVVTGEVVVIRGEPHTLGDSPGRPAVEISQVLPTERSFAPATVKVGNGKPDSVIACGYFMFEEAIFNPIMSALPAVIHARLTGGPPPGWLADTLQYFLSEARTGSPGSRALLNRLAELMFVEIVRDHIHQLPEDEHSWLAALRNPIVGKVLQLIHEDPSLPWTVESLAGRANVSRSGLADHFTRQIGMPPIQYLSKWRILIASRLLEESGGGLASIAAQVGYDSEAALNRAYKRVVGVAPVTWLHSTGNGTTIG
jgi:AraC-like DNA-binding protein